jgi:signal transduction histidine kinase
MPGSARAQWAARYLLVPAIVAAIGLVGTAAVTAQFIVTTEGRDRDRFDLLVGNRVDEIQERLESYIGLLRGAAGLATLKPDISREDWQAFVAKTRVQELYPGIQGIGFSRRFQPAEREAVLAAMRSQGFDDFTLLPEHQRPEYSAIVYLEPLDRRNRAALGYDMLTEETRRRAMERARDTGRRAVSGKVELVQEIDSDKQAGFLIYLPVYENVAMPATMEERRQRLIGWAYSPFRATDLFRRSFGGLDSAALDFAVYDGPADPANLLYASDPGPTAPAGARHFAERSLDIGDRAWTVRFTGTSYFELQSNRGLAPYVGTAGILMTVLLAGAAWAQARATRTADMAREDLHAFNETLEARIEHRTAELSRARSELQTINQNLETIVALRTADLEAANEEIQRFAYIVSHDLRAPLVNIMGFTSELEAARAELIAAGGLPEGDPERERALKEFDESLSFIRTATSKMDVLIGAILRISREGRRTFKPERLDMTTLVQNLADAIRHQTEAVGASVVVDALPEITADRLAIEQIFGNLVDNAVKYLQPGRLGQIQVEAEERARHVQFRVRDNGRGIAPADHARVFELFRRAGAQDRPGEGIGLAHVKMLVRALGGRIDLESEPGIGTTFSIILPKQAVRA